MKTVSDIVTVDEIRSWNNGDIITIKAGTGRGKSYLIKNKLYAFAKKEKKKILFLLHRNNCIDQFVEEVKKDKKDDVITIHSYQYIEAKDNKSNHVENSKLKYFDFSGYEYIVCDEFHYFLSDAAFNINTDISLNSILSQKNITKIFMSATGDYMNGYLQNKKSVVPIKYELPIDYNFISELSFFNSDDTIEMFANEAIERNEKTIFFIQSAKKAHELYKKYKDHALFNCSQSNDLYKHVDENKIKEMLKNEKFEELLLFTTTTMDAGVNIKDEEVKHIVCDVKDIATLIQCIGRKRMKHKDDKTYLYIKNINNKQLANMETRLKKKIEKADFFKENEYSVRKYVQKFGKKADFNSIVYDEEIYGEDSEDKCTKKINELMYYKCKIDLHEITKMKEKGDFGYCKYLARLFGFVDNEGNYIYSIIEEDDKKNELEEYLASIEGKIMLQVKNRKELIEKINVRDGNNNRLLKNIKTLNGKLEETGSEFMIKQFETSRIINGKKKNYKQAWKVIRIKSVAV